MRRIALLGTTVGHHVQNSYSPLDLLRYGAAGERQLIGSNPAYVSFDDGTTAFRTTTPSAAGIGATGPAPARRRTIPATPSSGTGALQVSAADKEVMNVLGYAVIPS